MTIDNRQAADKSINTFIYRINCVFNTLFPPSSTIVTRFHVQFRNPPLKCETRIDWQIYPLILLHLPYKARKSNLPQTNEIVQFHDHLHLLPPPPPLPSPPSYFKRGNNRIAARIHFYKYKYARTLLFSALNNYLVERWWEEGGRACK